MPMDSETDRAVAKILGDYNLARSKESSNSNRDFSENEDSCHNMEDEERIELPEKQIKSEASDAAAASCKFSSVLTHINYEALELYRFSHPFISFLQCSSTTRAYLQVNMRSRFQEVRPVSSIWKML